MSAATQASLRARATPTLPRTTLLRELATLGPPATFLGGLLLVAVRGDAFPGEVVLALAAIAAFHLLPGVLLWRAVRPQDGWLVEDLAMGLAIGAALSVPAQVLTVVSGLDVLAFAVPVLLVALLLELPGPRARILSRAASPLPWWWGASLAPVLVVGTLEYLKGMAVPVRWTGYASRYVDRGFHEGLVDELLHRFPLRYPWVASEEVSYHWFSHAWNASVVTLSGAPVDVVLWRITPALLNVAAPLLLAIVAVRLTRLTWTGPMAAAVAYLASTLQPWRLGSSSTPFAFESPSQEFAALVYPALLALIALRWTGRLGTAGGTGLTLLLLLVCAGTKGTTLAVLLPALLLAAAATVLFARSRLRVVLTDTALTVGVFVLSTAVIFGGETKNLEVVPFEWMATRMGGSLGGVPEILSPAGLGLVAIGLLTTALVGAGVLAALVTRAGRTDPVLWLFVGGTCSGIGALLVFVQVAQSHVYFYKVSLVPFGLAVACAAAHVAEGTRPARPLLTGLLAGTTAAAVIAVVGGPWRSEPSPTAAWLSLAAVLLLVVATCAALLRRRGTRAVALAAAVGMVASAALGSMVSFLDHESPERLQADRAGPSWTHASDVRVMRWLRDHSDPEDLVATNRHCRGATVPDCDRRRFDVASYSERRVLVEGWAYTPKADAQYDKETGKRWQEFWDTELIEDNDRFFTAPDAAGRAALLDRGVRWLVLDDRAPGAKTLEPWAELRHEGRHLSVYELVPAGG